MVKLLKSSTHKTHLGALKKNTNEKMEWKVWWKGFHFAIISGTEQHCMATIRIAFHYEVREPQLKEIEGREVSGGYDENKNWKIRELNDRKAEIYFKNSKFFPSFLFAHSISTKYFLKCPFQMGPNRKEWNVGQISFQPRLITFSIISLNSICFVWEYFVSYRYASIWI